jgi:hypothetical protein
MKSKFHFRCVIACLLAFALLLSSAFAASEPSGRIAVELTFLKANPGQREQLKAFIVANWFAMDKSAKEQGLMRSYTVLDTGTDEGPWNVVVMVTYHNDQGYDGIKEAFEKIRRAHKTVLIEGKSLRELGTVVETKRVFGDSVQALP